MQITWTVPDEILHTLLDPVALPEVVHVHYAMDTPPPITDIPAVMGEQMRRGEVRGLIRPGQRIAIGVGSRGIGNLAEIVAALVGQLQALGAQPFLFPAMGSHGGATAAGQRDVLAHLGITGRAWGRPCSRIWPRRRWAARTMASPCIWTATPWPPTALSSWGGSSRTRRSGAPMRAGWPRSIAIGLGRGGAAACHAAGFGDMARRVPLVAGVALARTPILFGVAVVENAHDQPYLLTIVPAGRIMADEPALLELARAAMPSIPFAQLDVLVLDKIGKNISGDGADPNITGKFATPFAEGGPQVAKQVVLDLTDETEGNGNGIGTADFTTVRAATKTDLGHTYPNGLTSTVVAPVALPMMLPSDRLAIAAAVLTCNAVGRPPRLMRIASTLQLQEFVVSTALLDEVKAHPALEILAGPAPLPFDSAGNLRDLGRPDHRMLGQARASSPAAAR